MKSPSSRQGRMCGPLVSRESETLQGLRRTNDEIVDCLEGKLLPAVESTTTELSVHSALATSIRSLAEQLGAGDVPDHHMMNMFKQTRIAHDDLHRQLRLSREEISRLTKSNWSLRHQLEEHTTLLADIQTLRTTATKSLEENELLRRHLAAASKNSQVITELEELRMSYTKCKADLSTCQDMLARAEKEVERSRTELQKMTHVEKIVERDNPLLAEEIQRLRAQNERLVADLTMIQSKQTEHVVERIVEKDNPLHLEEIERLKKEVSTLTDRLQTATSELRTAKSSHKERLVEKIVEKDNPRLLAERDRLTSELKDVRVELDTLRRRVEDYDDLESSNDELRRYVRDLEMKLREDVSEDGTCLRPRCVEARRRLNECESELQRYREEAKNRNRRNSTSTRTIRRIRTFGDGRREESVETINDEDSAETTSRTNLHRGGEPSHLSSSLGTSVPSVLSSPKVFTESPSNSHVFEESQKKLSAANEGATRTSPSGSVQGPLWTPLTVLDVAHIDTDPSASSSRTPKGMLLFASIRGAAVVGCTLKVVVAALNPSLRLQCCWLRESRSSSDSWDYIPGGHAGPDTTGDPFVGATNLAEGWAYHCAPEDVGLRFRALVRTEQADSVLESSATQPVLQEAASASLRLQGGGRYTQVITCAAECNGGGVEQWELVYAWYRGVEDGSNPIRFTPIQGVNTPEYQPLFDDVGRVIKCSVTPRSVRGMLGVAASAVTPPLTPDPEVEGKIRSLLSKKLGKFKVYLASAPDSPRVLLVMPSRIVLAPLDASGSIERHDILYSDNFSVYAHPWTRDVFSISTQSTSFSLRASDSKTRDCIVAIAKAYAEEMSRNQ